MDYAFTDNYEQYTDNNDLDHPYRIVPCLADLYAVIDINTKTRLGIYGSEGEALAAIFDLV